MDNSTSGTITAYCAMFDEGLFQRGRAKLEKSTLKATRVDDTHIYGDINVEEDGLFYTSISYSTGWKAFVDGQEVEITPVSRALLAFPLGKGEHHIELKYMPQGFIPGVICTILALAIFVAMIFIIPKRRTIFAKLYAKFPEPEATPDGEKKPKKATKNSFS
jgi:uncharacterized membrane protein YfhO